MMFERLIWLVPAAVAAFGIWRPRAGLLVLAACLPLFGAPPGGPYLGALDVAAIAAILTALRAPRADRSPLTWPIAAFVAVSLASLVPATYQPPGWHPSTLLPLFRALPGVEIWSALYTWRAAASLVLGWGLFMAVRRAFAGRSPMPLAQAFLAGVAGVLVLGVASQGGLIDLGGFRPLHPIGRLYSVFFLSGWLSEYLVLAAPLAIVALAAASGWGRRLALPLGALAIACLGFTHQRGAWIAALAQILFWTAIMMTRRGRPRRISKAVLQASGALALTGVVFMATGTPIRPILERARSMESGLSARLPLWTAAAELTRERPLLGWGLGSFAPAYDLAHPRNPQGKNWNRNTAHSLYFDIAAERGFLGLFALGLLGWSVAVCLGRPRHGQEAIALALGVSLLGAGVYGLVQYLFHLKSIAWLLWLLLGCVALATRPESLSRSNRVARVLFAAAVLLLPIRAILGDATGYAGDRAFGFHELERDASGSYRWTEGSAVRRIPWAGETLVLDLANGHPKASGRPVDVVVGIDRKTVARLRLSGGWEKHSIELGPPLKEEILLSFQVRPTFRPFSNFRQYPDLTSSVDIRSLGVAIREPVWE